MFNTSIFERPAMQAGLVNRQFTFRDVFAFLFAILRMGESNLKMESN